MLDPSSEFTKELIKQREWKYRGRATEAGFKGRDSLTKRYANHLVKEGKPVTFEAIRAMLQFLNRGYSLGPQQISAALASQYHREKNPLPKMPNGKPVCIEGAEYPSARSAAEALGISPQTVLNRIASTKPTLTGWTHKTVLHPVPDYLSDNN